MEASPSLLMLLGGRLLSQTLLFAALCIGVIALRSLFDRGSSLEQHARALLNDSAQHYIVFFVGFGLIEGLVAGAGGSYKITAALLFGMLVGPLWLFARRRWGNDSKPGRLGAEER